MSRPRRPEPADAPRGGRPASRRALRLAAALLLAGTGCGGPGAPEPAAAPARFPAAEDAGAGVWTSPEGCAAALAAGDRLERRPGAIRLATWNLRWFPRGCPQDRDCPGAATDVDWLACGIAWMQVDVLAVQEVLRSEAGERGLDALVRGLDARTGGRWQSDVQSCGETGAQAVGFLWDADRVALEERADLWELNGDRRAGPRDACAARLRPGRYARLRTPDGLDASLVAVHLDSGRRGLDFERRRRALGRLRQARLGERRLLDVDEDVVVLGDFNSMGRAEEALVSPAAEIASLGADLGAGFQPTHPRPVCTAYYRSAPERHARTLLDHAYASPSLRRAVGSARVSGFCATLGCPDAIDGAMPAAFERLSDHCPVLVDLEADDRDPG